MMESKFEKNDEQDDIHTAYSKLYKVSEKHEKLYRLATRKLSEVELEREELSTKVDKANQTTRARGLKTTFLLDFLSVFGIMLSCIALFLHLFFYIHFFYFFYCFQEKKKK